MLDYKLLEALVAVVECGGFEKAADRLNVTQSAVSQRIKLLESRLGGLVLIRSNPPKPTALGHRLDNHYHRIVQLENELGIDKLNDTTARARIVTTADALGSWFNDVLCDIGEELLVELIIEDQDVGLERMKRGEVLASLCSDDHVVNGSRVDVLGSMRYCAYASPEFMQKHDLQEDLSKLYQAPCLIYNSDDTLQHRYLALLGQPEPEHAVICPSIDAFVTFAKRGYGFGMLCELQVRDEVKKGTLINVCPDYYIDVPMFWHSWRASSEIMLKLRSKVIEKAKKHLIND